MAPLFRLVENMHFQPIKVIVSTHRDVIVSAFIHPIEGHDAFTL